MPTATELPSPRFADPNRCPDCRRFLPAGDRTRCATCGLPLQGQTAADLFATLQSADRLLAQLRSRPRPSLPPVPPVPSAREWVSPYPAGPTPQPAPQPMEHRRQRPPAADGPGSAWTVPGVLLALGALCLLVGAAVFLAVAWAMLGVGGRTAVLVGVTAMAALAADRTARRGLRGAAETLSLVSGAFLVLDLGGAYGAGWYGGLDVVTAILCSALAVAIALAVVDHLLAPAPTGRLLAPQALSCGAVVVATLAALARFGDTLTTTAVVAVVVLLGAARLVHLVRQPILTAGLVVSAGIAWSSLLADGAVTVAAGSSGAPLATWPEVTSLLAAATLAVLLVAVRSLPALVRQVLLLAGCAVAGLASALAVVSSADDAVLVAAAGAGTCAILAAASPWRWATQALRVGALGYATVATLPPLLTVLGLVAALSRVVGNERSLPGGLMTSADPHGYGFVVSAGWTVPVAVACLVLGVVGLWHPRRRSTGSIVLLALPVLDVTVLCYRPYLLLAVGGAAALAALHLLAARRASTWWGRPTDLAAAAGWAAVGGWLALYHSAPALALASSYAVVATIGALRGSRVLGCVAPVLVAAAVAALGWLAEWPVTWAALGAVATVCVHALAVGAAGRPAGRMDGAARLCLYGAALPIALLAGLVSASAAPGEEADRMVATLVVLGCAAGLVAILERIRAAAWLAAGLQLGALWLRLADADVRTTEAYSLPLAVALLAFGAWALVRSPGERSAATLLPGLGAALVPTLVVVATDPVSLRAVLLAAGCAAALAVGATGRLQAPLLAGAVGGAALAVIELAPYHDAVPRWVALTCAGLVLLVAGIRWEHLAARGLRAWGRLGSLR